MSDYRPFDAGLQIERTTLSWRRTALSITVGSLVALRLLPEVLGHPIWVLPGVVGVVGALTLWMLGWWRHRRFIGRVQREGRASTGGGTALGVVALVCAAVGAVSAALVIMRAFGG